MAPFLSQMNTVRNFSPYFCKIHFNIILPYTLMYFEWPPPSDFIQSWTIYIYIYMDLENIINKNKNNGF